MPEEARCEACAHCEPLKQETVGFIGYCVPAKKGRSVGDYCVAIGKGGVLDYAPKKMLLEQAHIRPEMLDLYTCMEKGGVRKIDLDCPEHGLGR